MPDAVVIYTVVHQPRRPRLPAAALSSQASPAEWAEALFDEPLNRRYFQKVARYCYHRAVDEFMAHLDAGLKLSIGFSFSFLRQAEAWDRPLLEKFRRLVAHPHVELVGVEPYHSFLFWLDLDLFRQRMAWMREALANLFGKRPVVTDTTEMILSPEICAALESLGFRGVFAEGRQQLLEWRSPAHLYRQEGGTLLVLPRHNTLSDDVGYRFSNRDWEGYPLLASDYVRWIRDAAGQLVVLGWDFETFGEHHSVDSGIFEFLRWLPGEFRHQGVATLTAGEALERFGDSAYELELPVAPSTWAGRGDMSFFLGNPIQQRLFHLMRHAYHLARLSGDAELLDIALWLCQSDNLHVLNFLGSAMRWQMGCEESSSEAEVAAYFTADEWWRLGQERLVQEVVKVYRTFIAAVSEGLARRPVEPAEALAGAEEGEVLGVRVGLPDEAAAARAGTR